MSCCLTSSSNPKPWYCNDCSEYCSVRELHLHRHHDVDVIFAEPIRVDKKMKGVIKGLMEGDMIYARYRVLRFVGQGTFGTVLECYDTKRKKSVAVKVIRSVEKYMDAGYNEIDIHDTLREMGSVCHVRLLKYFEIEDHLFLVFDLMNETLDERLERVGPSLQFCKHIGYQLLKALQHCHAQNLIHTDIKPENVMFDTNNENDMYLIDFGNALVSTSVHALERTYVITTQEFRAPEVILGLVWNTPVDIWSAACVLYELATGDQLFPTSDPLEQLARMEKLIGVRMEQMMCLYAYESSDEKNNRKYTTESRLNWPNGAVSQESIDRVSAQRSLTSMNLDSDLVDLLRRMLMFDPSQRITAKQAIEHPFFDECRECSRKRKCEEYVNNES